MKWKGKLKNSFLSQLLSKVIHYYSHDYYQLTPTALKKVAKTSKIKVLVVARQHYLERQIRLPITLKKDVKAAMAFEIADLEQSFHVFYKVTAVIDGVSHIHLWQVPRDIIPEHVRLVLPESFLFYHAMNVGQILHYGVLDEQKSVFIAKTQTSFQSMVDNIEQLALFSQATGVSLEQVDYIEQENFPAKLLLAITSAIPELLLGFWCSHHDKADIKAQLKPFILPTFTVFLAYMLISSAYISMRHDSVLSQVSEQKSDIDKVLTLQSEITALEQELDKFASLTQGTKPLWNIWPVLAPLFEQKVIFKFIRFNSKEVFFSAYAPSAANVLEYLLDTPEVGTASFTTAVRKIYGKEEFVIKFSLSDETTVQKGAE